MRYVRFVLLLGISLGACGGSTTSDAGVDVVAPIDAPDVVAPSDVRDGSTDAPIPNDIRVDAEPYCDVPGTYTYGLDGGLVPYRLEVTLRPGRSFTFTRIELGRVDAGPCDCTCTTMLEFCGTSDGGTVDTLGVIYAFNDPDVVAAFADQTNTLYGRDSRPVDGQVFVVTRGDGRRIEIGDACNGGMGCREIPAGLARLRAVLTTLQAQELARPPCNRLGA